MAASGSVYRPPAPQDLSRDPLLGNAPRDAAGRPVLGGIPLLARLGHGGMGAVYYGRHPRLQEDVAVKVLLLLDAGGVERFQREARLAFKLSSSYIVRVHDVNEQNGLHYMVMEYVCGCSAQDYLERIQGEEARGIEEAEALAIVTAATRGLAAAHEEGIIHRDIKPANILIPRARQEDALELARAKLSDLGLAKTSGLQGMTASGAGLGTIGFMAPEQYLRPKTAGPAADVYSMGAALYALLAGRPPFEGLGFLEPGTMPQPLEELRTELRPGVAGLVRQCLAPEPQARFADGVALLKALERVAGGLEDGGPPSAPGQTRSTGVPPVQPTPRTTGGTPVLPAAAARLDKLLRQGNLAEAAALCEQMQQAGSAPAAARGGQMVLLFDEGRLDEAHTVFEELQHTAPENPYVARFRKLLEPLGQPVRLVVQPNPLAFSFQDDDLAQGLRRRALLPYARDHLNLGDAGMAALDLLDRMSGGAAIRLREHQPEQKVVEMEGAGLKGRFSYHLSPVKFSWFRSSDEHPAYVCRIELAGEPLTVLRFGREFLADMETRFGRRLDSFLSQEATQRWSLDIPREMSAWEIFQQRLV